MSYKFFFPLVAMVLLLNPLIAHSRKGGPAITNKMNVEVGAGAEAETVSSDLRERSVKWRYAVPARLIHSGDNGFHDTASPLEHIRRGVFNLALSNPHCLHELNVLIVDEVNRMIGQENLMKIEARYADKEMNTPILATVFDQGTTSLSGELQPSTEVHYFLLLPDANSPRGITSVRLFGMKSEQMENFSFCELVENFEEEKEVLLADFMRKLKSTVRVQIRKILLDFEEDFGELNTPGNATPSGSTTIL